MTENSETEQKEIIPIRLLQAIGALLLFTLLIVAYARLSDMPLLGVPKASPVLREIVLDFQKKNDGSIVILDESGKELINSKVGSNGFISVVYDGLSYERKKKNISKNGPVKLVQHKDGRLTIIDESTSWDMHLNSFGALNVAVFGKLIN